MVNLYSDINKTHNFLQGCNNYSSLKNPVKLQSQNKPY